MNRLLLLSSGPLFIAAAARTPDSGSTLVEAEATLKQSSQPVVPIGQSSNLHRQLPSQIDSVMRDFTLDSATVPLGTLLYWTNLDDVTHRIVSGAPGGPPENGIAETRERATD